MTSLVSPMTNTKDWLKMHLGAHTEYTFSGIICSGTQSELAQKANVHCMR